MPNIIVKIPAGVLDQGAQDRLVRGINAAAAQAEQIPDDPKKRFLCWVVIEEIGTGNWTCGATDMSAGYVPVMVQVHLPAGVLDTEARAGYVQAIHQAVTTALPEERRTILTSTILNEVAEGQWGVGGTIWSLQDFAARAGFAHLQHLLVTAA